jgi:hypothetical protein
VLLSVPGSHLVDCLDSLLCLWFFHRVIESGGNLLPFVRMQSVAGSLRSQPSGVDGGAVVTPATRYRIANPSSRQKVLEIAKREAMATSDLGHSILTVRLQVGD